MGVPQTAEAVDGATLAPLFASPCGVADDEMTRRRTRRTIGRAADGDRDALQDLYLRYSGPVYRHVRGVIRDEHEAQDITQLVFLKLIAALPVYDERHGPFRPWLLRVARNLAIDQIRRRRAVPAEPVPDGAACDDTERQRAGAFYDALAELSDDQREVLVLRQIVGLRPREIAARMDRTEGSVHALHHRARAAMRASLELLEAAPATRGARPSPGVEAGVAT
jgi:RNA polymerase sigma-70 factor, ECF subfamily